MMIELRRLLLVLLLTVLFYAPCEGKGRIDVFALAEHGTLEKLQKAVSDGANFNVKRNLEDEGDNIDFDSTLFDYGDTPLHHAAMYNHNPDSIKFLVSLGLDVNAEASSGNTIIADPLSCAVRNKNIEALEALLNVGANPNSWSSGFGRATGTPFNVIAIEYEDYPLAAKRIVEALIKAGGDVNKHLELSSEELASLMEYEEGFADGKIFLPRNKWISNDPFDNIHDFSNVTRHNLLATLTPLMYAVLYDNPGMVNILLDANANSSIRSGEGKTAMDYATELPSGSKLKHSKAFKRLMADSPKVPISLNDTGSFSKMYPIERTE